MTIALNAITVLVLLATGINVASTIWYSNQSVRWRTDYALAQHREANKPWYVRICERVMGGRR